MATNDRENLKLVRDNYDLFSMNDLGAIRNNFTEDATMRVMPSNEVIRGRNAILDYLHNFKTAFPDMTLNIRQQIACGDHVVTEFAAHGTHQGLFHTPIGDIPPTGRTCDVAVCELVHVRNYRITEIHQYWDSNTLLNQLGVLNRVEERHNW